MKDRGWLVYIPPFFLACMAGYMAYFRYMQKDEQIPEVLIPTPPGQSTVEQLLALQQALAQLEGFLKVGLCYYQCFLRCCQISLPSKPFQNVVVVTMIRLHLIIFVDMRVVASQTEDGYKPPYW